MIKGKRIDVFELVNGDAYASAERFSETVLGHVDATFIAMTEEWAARFGRYTPILRFILLDKTTRTFSCERWCYRSSVNGWLLLGQGMPANLVRGTIPKLGSDSFFDLQLWSLYGPE